VVDTPAARDSEANRDPIAPHELISFRCPARQRG